MHIAFDPQIFALQQYGGISRYFFETAARLAKMPDTRVSILAHAHVNAYLGADPVGELRGHLLPAIPEPARVLLAAADRMLARRWLARHRVDIVHETYYAPKAIAPSGVPAVITVLDMIHEKFPHFAAGVDKVVRIKRRAIERADHIICISENTRRDLLEVYPMSPAKTSVVRLGFSLQAATGVTAAKPCAEPYVLHVGKRGGYKNFDNLLQAYAAASAINRDYLLVCFGDAPFSVAESARIAQLGLGAGRVRHLSGDDTALAAAYRHAALFVYPSRYEGFGIPPLEAMSFDCPVACSNAASLPEVVGDAAEMFDPDDVAAIGAALQAVLGSKEQAALLRARGRDRLKLFSWDLCAQQTRAVYASLLNAAD